MPNANAKEVEIVLDRSCIWVTTFYNGSGRLGPETFLLHKTEVHYAPHPVKIKSNLYLTSIFQNLTWKNGPSYLALFDL